MAITKYRNSHMVVRIESAEPISFLDGSTGTELGRLIQDMGKQPGILSFEAKQTMPGVARFTVEHTGGRWRDTVNLATSAVEFNKTQDWNVEVLFAVMALRARMRPLFQLYDPTLIKVTYL